MGSSPDTLETPKKIISEKVTAIRTGWLLSEETKRKIGDSNRGKTKSKEHCKALSLAHKGKSPGNKGKKMYYTPEGRRYYA